MEETPALTWNYLQEHRRKEREFWEVYVLRKQEILEGSHSPSNWTEPKCRSKGAGRPTEKKALALIETEEQRHEYFSKMDKEAEQIKNYLETMPKCRERDYLEMMFLLCLPDGSIKQCVKKANREQARYMVYERAGQPIPADLQKYLNKTGKTHSTGIDYGRIRALAKAGWSVYQIMSDTGFTTDQIQKALQN